MYIFLQFLSADDLQTEAQAQKLPEMLAWLCVSCDFSSNFTQDSI